MNKARIKELLESMGLEVAVYDGDNYCGEGFDFNDFESFAELIVKECARIAEQTAGKFEPDIVAEIVRMHFGVEK